MERSTTARLALGRLALPFGAPLRRSRPSAARRPSGSAGGRERPARGLPGLDAGRAALALAWRRRATRIALLAVIASLPLLGGGYLLLRHSSLVAVQHVRISGVRGAEAPAIEAALESAARRMSTLDVHSGALRAAVAQFGVVREVRATAQFPHGLSIAVVEQLPVAALVAGGVRTAVAADGVVLGGALLSSTLPTLGGWVVPAPGAHLHDRGLLAALHVLGAAPAALAAHVARAYTSAQGLTVAMRNGLIVYFGDDVRPHAKWLSLARVLADPSSKGAIYVDVRLPGRPAAGFPAGAAPALQQPGAEGSERTAGAESPVGALAEDLAGPAGKTGSGAGAATGAGPAESSPTESSTGGESPSGAAGAAAGSGGATGEAGSASGAAGAPAAGAQGATEAPTAGG